MSENEKVNIASGYDVVPVQAGRVTGRPATPKAKPSPRPRTGGSVNIRSGNAEVGLQTDVVIGDIVIGGDSTSG